MEDLNFKRKKKTKILLGCISVLIFSLILVGFIFDRYALYALSEHTFGAIIPVLFWGMLCVTVFFFDTKYYPIYPFFERRKEKVKNIYWNEAKKMHNVTTDKGCYNVNIKNKQVVFCTKIIEEKIL